MTTWIRRYAQDRSNLVRPGAEPAVEQQAAQNLDRDDFGRLFIKKEVADRHGAILEPCLGDMDAIALAREKLEPHRARQYERTVQGFYQALAKTLSKSSEEDRPLIAQASIRGLRRLIDEIGSNERLMPSIAAFTSLIDLRGDHGPRQAAENAPAALAAVLSMANAHAGRLGGHTALHLYRNLIELLERRTKNLPAVDRPQIWKMVEELIERAAPVSGVDQVLAGRLNAFVLDALGRGVSPKASLEEAEAKVTGAWQQRRDVTLDQIGASIEAIPAGTASVAAGLLGGALRDIVEKNPAGDERLYQAVQSLIMAIGPSAHLITDDNLPLVRNLSKIAGLVARSPSLPRILEFFAKNFSSILACPPETLADVANGGDPKKVPGALVQIAAMLGEQDRARLGDVLATLEKLPATLAAATALAVLPYIGDANIAGPMSRGLAERSRHAADFEELEIFAAKFDASFSVLQAHLGEDAGRVASLLSTGYGAALPADDLTKIGQLAASVKAILPEIDLVRFLQTDGRGRPGIADLRGLRHDPAPLLLQLLQALAELPKRDPELVRSAIHIAREAAMIDRDVALAFPRMLEDWFFGLNFPGEITFAPVKGKQAQVRQQKRDAVAFLDTHRALPPELAFTAGRFLSEKQLRWLLDQIESVRTRSTIRVYRDLVFAAVGAKRLDLIDAMAAKKVDAKTLMKTAEFVAVELRQGRAEQIPFDRIVEGLGSGRDPIAAILKERKGGGINLANATEDGKAALERFKPEFHSLLEATPPGGQIYSAPTEKWREPLEWMMQLVADERWPMGTIEGQVAERQLAGLTGEQLAIWMTDEISGTPNPGQADRADVQRAFLMLKGLVISLEREVRIAGPGFEDVGWDQASLDRLRQLQAPHIEAVRNAVKGSAEHKAASAALGPINRRIGVLELRLAIDSVLAKNLDPLTTLLEVKGHLAVAERGVQRLGGRGSAEAIREIRHTAGTIMVSATDARYAIDDNSLEAYFRSWSGGCIEPMDGSNKVSLTELMASAMYKMGRVLNGGALEARSLIRLFPTKLSGYAGYTLQLDILRDASAGSNISAAGRSLMHEHMIAKATAMKIPYVTNDPVAIQVAEAKGLRVLRDQSVVFTVDHGYTGLHHSQNIDWYQSYWHAWKPNDSGTVEADQINAEFTYTKHVIIPLGARVLPPA